MKRSLAAALWIYGTWAFSGAVATALSSPFVSAVGLSVGIVVGLLVWVDPSHRIWAGNRLD